jgi:5-methylcytosine-specific restriction endonuclease McrA
MKREDVPATPRKAMSDARKRRIWEREGGKCWMCGQVTAMTGPEVRYDHRIPIELSGSEDDSNVFPLHREPCDRIKTKADAAKIAKMRRLRKKRDPDTRKPSVMKSRGFDKTVKRRLNGTVERKK